MAAEPPIYLLLLSFGWCCLIVTVNRSMVQMGSEGAPEHPGADFDHESPQKTVNKWKRLEKNENKSEKI